MWRKQFFEWKRIARKEQLEPKRKCKKKFDEWKKIDNIIDIHFVWCFEKKKIKYGTKISYTHYTEYFHCSNSDGIDLINLI